MLNLKLIRKNAGYSQRSLADKIGVSRSTVAMWEIGGSEPDNDALLHLSALLNVTIDELLGNKKEPPVPESTGGSLTDRQRDLLQLFANLPEAVQPEAQRYLEYLAASQDTQ